MPTDDGYAAEGSEHYISPFGRPTGYQWIRVFAIFGTCVDAHRHLLCGVYLRGKYPSFNALELLLQRSSSKGVEETRTWISFACSNCNTMLATP